MKKNNDCYKVIETIRREQFGLDVVLDDKARSIVKAQNDRTGRSLIRLSEQLYSNDAHFVLELIQNADDNGYETQLPTINFIITKESIEVQNNEKGFTEQNIKSLCDIGKSTKDPNDSRYIGQKGIGFKSVFRVTNAPEIHSKGYFIRFDVSKGDYLGYVVPTWITKPQHIAIEMHGGGKSNTRIFLPFKTEVQKRLTNIISKFNDVQSYR
eukprot:UN30887